MIGPAVYAIELHLSEFELSMLINVLNRALPREAGACAAVLAETIVQLDDELGLLL
jgi:hypothetical protein